MPPPPALSSRQSHFFLDPHARFLPPAADAAYHVGSSQWSEFDVLCPFPRMRHVNKERGASYFRQRPNAWAYHRVYDPTALHDRILAAASFGCAPRPVPETDP